MELLLTLGLVTLMTITFVSVNQAKKWKSRSARYRELWMKSAADARQYKKAVREQTESSKQQLLDYHDITDAAGILSRIRLNRTERGE